MENFIFGLRPVYEAIKAEKDIDKVLVRQNLGGPIADDLMSELRRSGINIQYVPTEKLDKICKANHQGVIAYISPVQYHELEGIVLKVFEAGEMPLIVILDSITDVRNFGAIARTCECAAVDAIVIPSRNSVRITEDAIKTSAGALFNIPVCRVDNLIDAVILLEQSGVNVFAVSEKASKDIYSTNLNMPLAIIMGAEDTGISKSLMKRVSGMIKIPMLGKTESLNVSVSAAIVTYEAVRQRMYGQ